MAGWQRHLSSVKMQRTKRSSASNNMRSSTNSLMRKYSSYLPAVYQGIPNRIDRYQTYETMDLDAEINTGLDILTDFCTQNNEDNGIPFDINYLEKMGDTEIQVLKDQMNAWCNLNDFQVRIWDIFRGVLKNGDQFFIRDPETLEWIWVDPKDVEMATVNEAEGKEPVQWFMKNLTLNLTEKVASTPVGNNQSLTYPGSSNSGSTVGANASFGGGTGQAAGNNSPFKDQHESVAVDATNVVHLSLNTGTDSFFPFGTSILESIFKVYKQKELLEDSIIIYRVQRAPERRVFKIDTGDLSEYQAMKYVEQLKNEMHQRRIPSRHGGGSSLMDAAYSPLSILEDYFFPHSADGRGSSVETLPGGENLGQIDDLRYFNNKLIRGLKIPTAYLPFGPEDSSSAYTDGRVGSAMIQEHRFSKYCQRLQSIIGKVFDMEFKVFLKESGYNIDSSAFKVVFNPPLNFTSYREAELMTTRLNIFGQVADVSYLSKQFILKKYAGLTEDEIVENERLWMEENGHNVQTGVTDETLRSVGVTPSEEGADLDGMDDETFDDEGIEQPEQPAPEEGEQF